MFGLHVRGVIIISTAVRATLYYARMFYFAGTFGSFVQMNFGKPTSPLTGVLILVNISLALYSCC